MPVPTQQQQFHSTDRSVSQIRKEKGNAVGAVAALRKKIALSASQQLSQQQQQQHQDSSNTLAFSASRSLQVEERSLVQQTTALTNASMASNLTISAIAAAAEPPAKFPTPFLASRYGAIMRPAGFASPSLRRRDAHGVANEDAGALGSLRCTMKSAAMAVLMLVRLFGAIRAKREARAAIMREKSRVTLRGRREARTCFQPIGSFRRQSQQQQEQHYSLPKHRRSRRETLKAMLSRDCSDSSENEEPSATDKWFDELIKPCGTTDQFGRGGDGPIPLHFLDQSSSSSSESTPEGEENCATAATLSLDFSRAPHAMESFEVFTPTHQKRAQVKQTGSEGDPSKFKFFPSATELEEYPPIAANHVRIAAVRCLRRVTDILRWRKVLNFHESQRKPAKFSQIPAATWSKSLIFQGWPADTLKEMIENPDNKIYFERKSASEFLYFFGEKTRAVSVLIDGNVAVFKRKNESIKKVNFENNSQVVARYTGDQSKILREDAIFLGDEDTDGIIAISLTDIVVIPVPVILKYALGISLPSIFGEDPVFAAGQSFVDFEESARYPHPVVHVPSVSPISPLVRDNMVRRIIGEREQRMRDHLSNVLITASLGEDAADLDYGRKKFHHMPCPLDLLRKSVLFHSCTNEEVREVASILRPASFLLPGAHVLDRAAPKEEHEMMFFVSAGCVNGVTRYRDLSRFFGGLEDSLTAAHQSIPDEWKDLIFYRWGPGECFGEKSLFFNEKYIFNISATRHLFVNDSCESSGWGNLAVLESHFVLGADLWLLKRQDLMQLTLTNRKLKQSLASGAFTLRCHDAAVRVPFSSTRIIPFIRRAIAEGILNERQVREIHSLFKFRIFPGNELITSTSAHRVCEMVCIMTGTAEVLASEVSIGGDRFANFYLQKGAVVGSNAGSGMATRWKYSTMAVTQCEGWTLKCADLAEYLKKQEAEGLAPTAVIEKIKRIGFQCFRTAAHKSQACFQMESLAPAATNVVSLSHDTATVRNKEKSQNRFSLTPPMTKEMVAAEQRIIRDDLDAEIAMAAKRESLQSLAIDAAAPVKSSSSRGGAVGPPRDQEHTGSKTEQRSLKRKMQAASSASAPRAAFQAKQVKALNSAKLKKRAVELVEKTRKDKAAAVASTLCRAMTRDEQKRLNGKTVNDILEAVAKPSFRSFGLTPPTTSLAGRRDTFRSSSLASNQHGSRSSVSFLQQKPSFWGSKTAAGRQARFSLEGVEEVEADDKEICRTPKPGSPNAHGRRRRFPSESDEEGGILSPKLAHQQLAEIGSGGPSQVFVPPSFTHHPEWRTESVPSLTTNSTRESFPSGSSRAGWGTFRPATADIALRRNVRLTNFLRKKIEEEREHLQQLRTKAVKTLARRPTSAWDDCEESHLANFPPLFRDSEISPLKVEVEDEEPFERPATALPRKKSIFTPSVAGRLLRRTIAVPAPNGKSKPTAISDKSPLYAVGSLRSRLAMNETQKLRRMIPATQEQSPTQDP